MKTIITTVGTSIFTNYFDKEKNRDISMSKKEHYEKLKDKRYSEWENYKSRIDRLKPAISSWVKENKNASAEIKSILKLKDVYKDIRVHFIATDTILSPLSIEVMGEYLIEKDIETDFDRDKDIIEGLRISNADDFRKNGTVNLVNRVNYIIDANFYKNVILNITGGYKAVIPYMTVMGQINNIPIYYIFEDTDELIQIPQAPIDIKWEIFEKYAGVLYELEKGILGNWEGYKNKNKIGDALSGCIWEEDDMAELNAIGKMFWEKYKTFFLVKINKGSSYLDDNRGNQNQIKEALKELYKRLIDKITSNHIENSDDLKKHIRELGDKNDLRHGDNPANDVFIFKSTKREQIRIVYSPELEGKDLKLRVYDYVRGGKFNHAKYIEEFKEKMKSANKFEFVTITVEKPI